MSNRVLVLGGYGVFGARLSRALIADGRYDVVVAGRNRAAAQEFCASYGGTPMALDRTETQLVAHLAELAPFIVIDAAGPFQDYGPDGYALARAAIACGAHYVDLSDDADFSAGISSLDDAARAGGVAVISGASSVPGLSSAAVEALIPDMRDIDLIESVILPGNRAPRGLSVVRAILAQVARPIRVWREGRWSTVQGWGGLRRETIEIPGAAPLTGRWSSYIGAPDLALFPERYGARTVLFRAGLELAILHWGLWALGLLVRLRLMRSLAPLARPVRWMAQWFEPFGSDRGGMVVRVIGTLETGVVTERRWLLLAEAGDGPEIPTLAARILCDRLVLGHTPPGARACLGEFTLDEVEGAARNLAVRFERN
ncbi:saccharopine dehydrogenase family protein [Arenibacterium sp. CAU 1754]